MSVNITLSLMEARILIVIWLGKCGKDHLIFMVNGERVPCVDKMTHLGNTLRMTT